MARKPPRVLVSYAHGKAKFNDAVLEVCDKLRSGGIDAEIDQYEQAPAQGWPRWMSDQIEQADHVLVVCTKAYDHRFRGKAKRAGKGVSWEGAIITQELYDSFGRNAKFIPVLMSRADAGHIPVILRGAQHYDLSNDQGYEALYRRLTGQPGVTRPSLGKIKPLAQRPRRSIFNEIVSQRSKPVKPPPPSRALGTNAINAQKLLARLEEIATDFSRRLAPGSDPLQRRTDVAREIEETCRKWARLLVNTFERAVRKWELLGRGAAAQEIVELQQDFSRIQYRSISPGSPLLRFLSKDGRFQSFVIACLRFYSSALEIKRLVYGRIQTTNKEYVSADTDDIRTMVSVWRAEVETVLRDVQNEYFGLLFLGS